MWKFIVKVYKASVEDYISARAAALAYYLIFAVVPILVLFFSIGGLLVDPAFLENQMLVFFAERFGDTAGDIVSRIMDNLLNLRTNIIVTAVSAVFTLWAATIFFNYLRNTFFMIFDVEVDADSQVKRLAKLQGVSFLYLALLFGLIFIFIAVNLILSVVFELWVVLVGIAPRGFGQAVQILVTFGLTGAVTGFVYRFTSRGLISWRSALVGGATAAIGFALLKWALGFYLATAMAPSIYGASGFILVFLLWNYLTGLMLFLGAEVAKVYNGHVPKTDRWTPLSFLRKR